MQTESTVASSPPQPILFFDGVCGLCNQAVDFVIRRDRAHQIRFAPLQGETASRLLGPQAAGDPDTMVFLDQTGRRFERSDAAVQILKRIGGGWGLAGRLLWLIPRPVRNIGYRIVASNRYRWFGRKESCRMPTAAERTLFLP